ncbi:microtubule cross-linking factor 1 [Labeo rohita]|uniref:Microtubule cross-linking factor 1 n=1 Tax=Labeo rohita TaxID=84645 RepID=A0A498MHU1_LABRO|nr:microtubule cross-linking factor 1 [Labeo rohita]
MGRVLLGAQARRYGDPRAKALSGTSAHETAPSAGAHPFVGGTDDRSDAKVRHRRAARGRAAGGVPPPLSASSADPRGTRFSLLRPAKFGCGHLEPSGTPRGGSGPSRFPPSGTSCYLVDPASNICLSQRLSHAGLSAHGRYSETANGSLNQLWSL